MGWLAAQGAIMAIGLFIGLVCSVIGLFFGHIILFDSIALGIAAGVCCNQFTAIHPALCLVIGIEHSCCCCGCKIPASAFGLSAGCSR